MCGIGDSGPLVAMGNSVLGICHIRVTIPCMQMRLILFMVSLAGALPGPGQAQDLIANVICANRDSMVERLTVQYGATLQGYGLRDIETVMEVWASPRGDWTLVQNRMDGQSCIVAMGADWAVPVAQTPAEG